MGTRSLAERLLRDGAVTVDGATRAKSHRLEAGSVVEVELPEAGRGSPAGARHRDTSRTRTSISSSSTSPPASPCTRGPATSTGTLAAQLLSLGAAGGDDPDRPGIVHRLDRETSGLMVVARTEQAFAALQEAIRQREVERRYAALVRGKPRSRTGRIDAPVGRDRRDPTRRSLDTEEPRAAVTWFELVEVMSEHALLDVRLESGRTHQIRVHLAAVDLPVSGDATYGVKGDLGLERQFLHAQRLRFVHPITQVELDLESPLAARSGAGAREGPRQLDSPAVFVPSTRRSAVAGVPSL